MRPILFRPLAGLMLATLALPLPAQVQTIDPETAIDADLAPPPTASDPVYYGDTTPPPASAPAEDPALAGPATPATPAPAAPGAPVDTGLPPPTELATANTYKEDDLIGAAENVFGKGAKGLADLIRKILREQGEPSAYIAGREASGAFVVGLRYGSGTLFHQVEGERPVYWTGPSVGFDAGGDAGSTFVLVYNLHDSQELYQRFPAGQGTAYLIGGFTASYMRSGDIVLIPIRLGVGVRLGANVGYMKFSEKQNWFPF